MNSWFLGLVSFAVIFEVIADILFKYWTLNTKHLFLIGGVILYSIGTVIWAFSLKYEYLSKAITIFTILNLVAIVLIGVLVFKEDLSLINTFGIILGIISVILIQL
ncbi:MAG: Small Multidrug Resistance protein [Candidatus Parcubacteria bacterium]|jgi:multidrug transporter EmrE-like cation transporter